MGLRMTRKTFFPEPALKPGQIIPLKPKPLRPMSYLYLATPYSHPVERVQTARVEALMLIYSYLLKERRETFFSPILHCYETARTYDIKGTSENFWRDNKAMLQRSSGIWVIENFTDWHLSVGLSRERGFAEGINLPVHYVRLKEVLSREAWNEVFSSNWEVRIPEQKDYNVLQREADLKLIVGSI